MAVEALLPWNLPAIDPAIQGRAQVMGGGMSINDARQSNAVDVKLLGRFRHRQAKRGENVIT